MGYTIVNMDSRTDYHGDLIKIRLLKTQNGTY